MQSTEILIESKCWLVMYVLYILNLLKVIIGLVRASVLKFLKIFQWTFDFYFLLHLTQWVNFCLTSMWLIIIECVAFLYKYNVSGWFTNKSSANWIERATLISKLEFWAWSASTNCAILFAHLSLRNFPSFSNELVSRFSTERDRWNVLELIQKTDYCCVEIFLIGQIEASKGLAVQIQGLITALQVLIEAYFHEEIADEPIPKKIPVILLDTMSILLHRMSFENAKAGRIFDWLKKLAQKTKVDTAIALTFIQLLMMFEERDSSEGTILDELCMELCEKLRSVGQVLPLIDAYYYFIILIKRNTH